MSHLWVNKSRLLLMGLVTVVFLAQASAWADNYQALRMQDKAVCQSNCMSAEGMVFLSQGGPFTGPNAVQKCYGTCECISQTIPQAFTETEFVAYATTRDAMLSQRYDQLVRTCVSQFR